MVLIEDLGMRFATSTSKRKVRFGLYECPGCLKHFACLTNSVNRGNTTKCASCGQKVAGRMRADTKSKNAADTFADVCSAIHDNRYTYNNVEYEKDNIPVAITCVIHNDFYQKPNDHKNGAGCPKCAESGFRKDKPAILYYIRITIGSVVAYKIGITNRTIQERFSNTDLLKIQILKTWEYAIGNNAYLDEQKILKIYKEYKYSGEPLLHNGNTEIFSIDILDLDTL